MRMAKMFLKIHQTHPNTGHELARRLLLYIFTSERLLQELATEPGGLEEAEVGDVTST